MGTGLDNSIKKLLVAGGYGGRKGSTEDTTEIYSYITKEWGESGKLPNQMFVAMVSNVDNRVFMFGNAMDLQSCWNTTLLQSHGSRIIDHKIQ